MLITDSKKHLIMLTAGGTGGHVYPAEALAEELEARGYELMLITDERGKNNYKGKLGLMKNVSVFSGGVVGKSKLFKIKSLAKTCIGIVQAMTVLLKYNPKCVVGFGGYASFPASVAAILLGKDLVLHEQNSVMSRTNRYLCKYASLVGQSFSKVKFVPERVKSVLCGMPVRAAIVAASQREFAQVNAEGKVQILILGGSQGAKVFGEVVPQAIAMLPEDLQARLRIFQQCRQGEEEEIKKAYGSVKAALTVSHFFENMAELYADTQLVISRSGASSVSEIAVMGVPSILVPLPTAADNHQEHNTHDLAAVKGAMVIAQSQFTATKLKAALEELIENKSDLRQMSENAKKAGIVDAAKRFADAIEKEIIRA